MLLAKKYLLHPKTQQVLSKKPGEDGFSLIELVVVVAVLAILVAVALPNFTLITHKARVNQGKNALVTALKECNVTAADTGTATYTAFTVDSFTVTGANGTAIGCANGFQIAPSTANQYPTFIISPTGTKSCSVGSNATTGSLGCTGGTAAVPATATTPAVPAVAGTWSQ